MKKNVALIVKLIFISIVTICVFLGVKFFAHKEQPNPYTNEARIIRDFEKHKDSFILIAKYLEDMDSDDVFIWMWRDTIEMEIDGVEATIKDTNVSEATKILGRRTFLSVKKAGYTIDFFGDEFRGLFMGIAYSINGEDPEIQSLRKLKLLSLPNWYYYEGDAHEWEER